MKQIIFCDLDGTLLPQGEPKIDSAVLSEIKRLIDKGVTFCVASGRPYSSLSRFFGPLSRNIVFICLDGALVMHRDCVLYKKPIKNASTLINGQKATAFFRMGELSIEENTKDTVCQSLINKHGGEVLKVALYSRPYTADGARLCYQKDGIYEYVDHSADKGAAAEVVLKKFCTKAENAAALGDGENDLALLRAVDKPFRMERCHSSLSDCGFPVVSSACEFLKMF